MTPPSPVRGGNPLGPGATKGSNSGMSVASELELATGTAVRPWLVSLGGGPEGAGGAGEGVRLDPWSDMVVIRFGVDAVFQDRKTRPEGQ